MSASQERRDAGFALLVVLWTLVLLALIVTQLGAAGRQEANLAGNLRSAAELGAEADGVVYEAVFRVMDASAAHWPANSRPHQEPIPGGIAFIRIESEAGKINPNSARPELLAALLRELGVDAQQAETIAQAIVTWRTPSNGASPMAASYSAAGRNYEPPQAPFESLRELGDVIGVTPAILDRLIPHLTLYHNGNPDPTVADPVVLQAMEDVYGPIPDTRRGPPDERVVAISVRATAVSGAEAVRSVVVRIGAGGGNEPFAVLRWRETVP